jgi:hypothetical protein
MAKKLLDNVAMGPSWTSFAAAAYGILTAAGMYDGDMSRFMGESGIGFHFIVDEETCPSSVTCYEWGEENFAALDRIGVYTDIGNYWNDGSLTTYAKVHALAIERIKASIDEGRAVLAWTPSPILEFGIIKGYDDADRVFFVTDVSMQPIDPMLYDNLGRSQVPILYYQIFGERVDVAKERVVRSSLELGLKKWKKEWHMEKQYGSGRKGYENLIGALRKKKWNDFGLAYILAVYADAKEHVSRYLASLAGMAGDLKTASEAAGPYTTAAENVRKMASLVPFQGANGAGGKKVDPQLAPQLAELASAAMKHEQKAMDIIEKVVGNR